MTKEDVLINIRRITQSKHQSIKNIELIIIHLEEDWEYFTINLKRFELSKYLYYTCHQFNHFSIPSPYVLHKKSQEYFTKSLRLLEKIEGKHYDNIACLQIDEIKWEIYNKIANENCKDICKKEIDKYLSLLDTTNEPTSSSKIKEFNIHKNKTRQLLIGLTESTLKTIIETRIPLTPVKKKTIISTKYKNRDTTIEIHPHFTNNEQSMLSVSESQASIPTTKSQWQNCLCEIKITIFGLIDPSQPSESLSIPPKEEEEEDNTSRNWPYIFNYLYYILEKTSWNIYNPEEHLGRWLIAPNDLGTVTWSVLVNNNEIEFISMDPPGLITKISTVSDEIISIDNLDIDTEKPWSEKCLLLARENLGMGNTNESLFWLNIGLESMLEQKVKSICAIKNIDITEISSSKSYWMNAKEIVEAYLPKDANKIEWPESKIGIPSWYSKIKYLSKCVILTQKHKDILKHYSNVNKYRNELFHGINSSRISGNIVLNAINSYCWINENFKLKEQP